MNIMHSSRSDKWGTPEDVITLVKDVLGDIDLDPASEPFFNEVVGAKRIITANALEESWLTGPGTVFLNPPGGKVGNKSLQALFWEKLVREAEEGRVSHAIFMAFSVEALQTTQRCHAAIMDFPFCVPRRRIKFVPRHGAADAPSHSNVIVYVPGTVDMSDLFAEVFSSIGKCA